MHSDSSTCLNVSAIVEYPGFWCIWWEGALDCFLSRGELVSAEFCLYISQGITALSKGALK